MNAEPNGRGQRDLAQENFYFFKFFLFKKICREEEWD